MSATSIQRMIKDKLSNLEKEHEFDDEESSESEEETPEPEAKKAKVEGISMTTKQTGKQKDKINSARDLVSTTIYLGHLPKFFEEKELHKFLSQFGEIEGIHVSRSYRTGHTRGYAFVKFDTKKNVEESGKIAEIVAQTLNGYLLGNKRLVCDVIPPSQMVHYYKMFSKKLNKGILTPQLAMRRKIRRIRKFEDNMWSEANKDKRADNMMKRNAKMIKKLEKLGVDYELPQIIDRSTKYKFYKDTLKSNKKASETPQKVQEAKTAQNNTPKSAKKKRKQKKDTEDKTKPENPAEKKSETPESKKKKIDSKQIVTEDNPLKTSSEEKSPKQAETPQKAENNTPKSKKKRKQKTPEKIVPQQATPSNDGTPKSQEKTPKKDQITPKSKKKQKKINTPSDVTDAKPEVAKSEKKNEEVSKAETNKDTPKSNKKKVDSIETPKKVTQDKAMDNDSSKPKEITPKSLRKKRQKQKKIEAIREKRAQGISGDLPATPKSEQKQDKNEITPMSSEKSDAPTPKSDKDTPKSNKKKVDSAETPKKVTEDKAMENDSSKPKEITPKSLRNKRKQKKATPEKNDKTEDLSATTEKKHDKNVDLTPKSVEKSPKSGRKLRKRKSS